MKTLKTIAVALLVSCISALSYAAHLQLPATIKLDGKTAVQDSVTQVLEKVFDLDQGYRRKYLKAIDTYGFNTTQAKLLEDSVIRQDSLNQKTVFKIIDSSGWPDNNVISKKASAAIFYVIQHAQLPDQLKYTALVKGAFERKQVAPSEYAMFADRLNVKQGKNQIYGTQSGSDNIGNSYLYPITDIEGLDERRKSMGLSDFKDHVQNSGIMYHNLPSNKAQNPVILIGHFFDTANKGVADVKVLLRSEVIGRTDKNGFFYISINKTLNKTLLVDFEAGGHKKIKPYSIAGNKDFYEIYIQLK